MNEGTNTLMTYGFWGLISYKIQTTRDSDITAHALTRLVGVRNMIRTMMTPTVTLGLDVKS